MAASGESPPLNIFAIMVAGDGGCKVMVGMYFSYCVCPMLLSMKDDALLENSDIHEHGEYKRKDMSNIETNKT